MMLRLRLIVAGLSAAALVSGACLAQDEVFERGMKRFRLGWADSGDAGNGLGLGFDYAARDRILVSLNYFNLDQADLWELQGSYLFRSKQTPEVYYGLGFGYYDAHVDVPEGQEAGITFTRSGGSFGVHAIAGLEDRKGRFFGEARYLIGANTGGGDLNGIRVFVGRRF